MNPKNYRIGNIFQDRSGAAAEIIKLVKPARGNMDEDHIKIQTIQGPVTELPCTPMPLTNEVAKKFGFFELKTSDIPTYYINYGKFDGEDWEGAFLISKDINDTFYIVVRGKKRELKFAHQLQNAFFHETEEELTFKL